MTRKSFLFLQSLHFSDVELAKRTSLIDFLDMADINGLGADYYGAFLKQEQELLNKIEYFRIKRQIEVIATFIPDEILKYKEDNLLQKSNSYVGVLLFADVSGFTPLTEKYNKTGKGGIYRLTATLNAYIGAIVEVIHFFGGDILKFSGDAFLALWKIKQGESLCEILHEVVVCALIIQKTLGYFDTEVNVQLKVKLAIACGNMTFTVIGDEINKHYIIAGSAIYDVKKAEHVSVSGDVIISPSAWDHMVQERYEVTMGEGGNVKIWNIEYRRADKEKRVYYEGLRAEVLDSIEKHLNHRRDVHASRNFETNVSISKVTDKFLKTIPERFEVNEAPKHWIVDELRAFIIKPVQEQIEESQPVEYLTEMREITVQFINIVPTSFEDIVLTDMCNKCYTLICKVVGEVLGVVNKVSLFDKDVMVLVLFGLRGVRHEMESQHALRSAYKIRKSLENFKNVETCSIGITNGLVYCGVVGHPFRREYTVIGTDVNKAARIMVAYPEKVICDYKTFKRSKLSSFYFKIQPPVKLKGIEDPGSIFEYNESFDDVEKTESVQQLLIGRNNEYNFLLDTVYGESGYRGVCLDGTNKIGKTAILKESIIALRQTGNYTVASLELNSKTSSPYFCVNRLYSKIYDARCTIYNEEISGKIDIPRELFDPISDHHNEDIALVKYRILNYFRNLLFLSNNFGIIIFIDNIEFIDLQSWEILEICFLEKLFILICSGNFEVTNWDLRHKLTLLNKMTFQPLGPLDSHYIAALACIFLDAVGIPNHLEYMLIQCCEGKPGYIQSSLLRLINNGNLQLKLIYTDQKDPRQFIFPPRHLLKVQPQNLIPIVEFSPRYTKTGQKLTLSAITMDLFDSFSPYQQLVIKTAAVLGEIFTRSLLLVALKYPSESNLCRVVQQLFEEEVFDCASKYIYGSDLDQPRMCCQCYFENVDFTKMDFPKYSYCKIIHFKNKSIRNVAYDLLPGNQKKELHLLCTEVIETSKNSCPSCIRQPINSMLHFFHFKVIMAYCADPKQPFRKCSLEYGQYGDMKEVIRKAIRNEPDELASPDDIAIRPRVDPNVCRCHEIWCRVFKDLMYHSEQGCHAGKLIYFTLKYGLMLMLVTDFLNAISYLRKARELCLSDVIKGITSTSVNFRKYIIGQVEVGLAKARLTLGQIKGAKNHLAIALRQYNIPSSAMQYRFFNEFLTRRFISDARTMRNASHANEIFRYDAANCLSYCAKVYAIEGKFKLAKLTAHNSLLYLRGANSNITLLSEVYCNAIEIWRFSDRKATFEKLQKEVFNEILINFGTLDMFQSATFMMLLHTLVEWTFFAGYIQSSIRLGYKLLDLATRLNYCYTPPKFYMELIFMLYLNAQFRDAANICNLLKDRVSSDPSNIGVYYLMAFLIYVESGFQVEEFDVILRYAKSLKISHTQKKARWEVALFLYGLLEVHYTRACKFTLADEWSIEIIWTAQRARRSDGSMSLLKLHLECKIIAYIRHYKLKNETNDVEKKRYMTLLEIYGSVAKEDYKIHIPHYYCFLAWIKRLDGQRSKSVKLLKKARKIAIKQHNILVQCLTYRLENAWDGGYSINYNNRPKVGYQLADDYTFKQFIHFQHAYPLDF